VSGKFEHYQRLLLFPWSKNFTRIGQFRLVAGVDSSVISLSS